MFLNCLSLTLLYLNPFNPVSETNIKKLVISNFSIWNSTDIDSLFDGCSYKFMKKIKAYIINIKKEILMNLIKWILMDLKFK